MEAALEVDAYPGFNASDLDYEAAAIVAAPDGVAVALDDDTVCGYVSPRHNDLTVHPQFRRKGHGRRLFAAGLDLVACAGEHELRLYVPLSGAGQAFARAMGMTYHSSMWVLCLSPEIDVSEPAFPSGVVVRSFGDWLPLPRLVALLNDSFAGHPGHPTWTLAQIEAAHARPDFDPLTTTLVAPADRPDEPIAFVRTAVESPADGDPAPIGEVRLVGVLAEWRGRGLGRELLRLGVAQLRARGAGRVKLSVEAENEVALGLYRRTGFEPAVEWPHWTHSVTVPGGAGSR
jgi:mycothiol synthase